MSKSLLNLLVQISKALVNSKIQFLIQKSFFAFGPANLTGPLGLWPSRPRWPLSPPAGKSRPHQHISPCVGGVFAEVRFPFWFTPSELVASLSSLCRAGPGYQLRLPPRAGRPQPCRHRIPPHCPLCTSGCRPSHYRSTITPLNPPLNLTPIFNGVKANVVADALSRKKYCNATFS
jgi:hypothetical protein